MANIIVHTTEINYYKEHAEKIDNLQDSYQRYYKNPTEITKDKLIADCRDNKMLDFVNYVNREIATEQLLPLMDVMRDDYNLTNFQYWAKMLVSSTSQAMLLHSICLGMEYPNSSDLNKTIAGDIIHFQSISDTLSRITHNGIVDIKDNFFEKAAKKDIHDYGLSHQSESHEDFVKQLYYKLKDKYYWRYWFVASYSGTTSSYDEHCITEGPWVYFWFRDLGRSVYISSTNNPINFQPKLQNCIDIHKSKSEEIQLYEPSAHTPFNINSGVSSCLGQFNGLGVIRHHNDLQAYMDLDQDPFINAELISLRNQLGIGPIIAMDMFSVFAIAPELDHQTYTIESKFDKMFVSRVRDSSAQIRGSAPFGRIPVSRIPFNRILLKLIYSGRVPFSRIPFSRKIIKYQSNKPNPYLNQTKPNLNQT